MTVELLGRAYAATRGVLANVTPDQYGLPTPCDAWDVRTLANHVVGGSYWYAEAMRDRVSPPMEGEDDDAAGDLLGAYDDGIREALAAFGAPGALDGTVHFFGRDRPATSVLRLAMLDTFVHGWDLARATQQSSDLDPAVAGELLATTVGSIPDALRGTDGDALYRPIVPVPDTVLNTISPADRLAAFMGRRP